MYFYDHQQVLQSIPTSWTDFLPTDLFITVSAGRSYFRISELLQLVSVIEDILAKKNV